jgi:hypothetical protein
VPPYFIMPDIIEHTFRQSVEYISPIEHVLEETVIARVLLFD